MHNTIDEERPLREGIFFREMRRERCEIAFVGSFLLLYTLPIIIIRSKELLLDQRG